MKLNQKFALVLTCVILMTASGTLLANQNKPPKKELITMFKKSVRWTNPPEVAKKYSEELVSLGPWIIPTLLPLMEKEFLMQQYGLQDIIYGMLNKYKPADTPEKEEALNNLKNKIAVHLRKHIKSHSYEGLRWLIRWLAELKLDPDIDLPVVITQINHPYWRVRDAVALSIGLIGSAKGSPYIEILLQDPVEEVRAQAAHSAGKIKDPGLILPLVKLLSDPLFPARMNAADALVKISLSDHQKLVENNLVPLLKSPIPKTRYITLEILGRCGSRKILEKVVPFLQSQDPVMKGFAVEAAGAIGGYKIKKILEKMYQEEKNMFIRGRLETVLNDNFGNRKLLYPKDYK